jgi:hypothetical protein
MQCPKFKAFISNIQSKFRVSSGPKVIAFNKNYFTYNGAYYRDDCSKVSLKNQR